jgi:putative oxidoreductase
MSSANKLAHIGLLVVRIGIGASFLLVHGVPKVIGGPDKWEQLGGAMGALGISFAPTFWGFMAAITEALGGLLLILGLGTRYASIFLAFVMVVAAAMHLGAGDGVAGASHAIELGIVFIGLILIGSGRYSVDNMLGRKPEAA